MDMHDPAYPGEILAGWLDDPNMTVTAFAAHIGTSRVMLSRILHGRRRKLGYGLAPARGTGHLAGFLAAPASTARPPDSRGTRKGTCPCGATRRLTARDIGGVVPPGSRAGRIASTGACRNKGSDGQPKLRPIPDTL